MRLSLQNQPEIESLSMALARALRALVAAIQTGWNQQHRGDGSHTDVTATALTVTPGTTALGKLNLASVTYIDSGTPAPVNNMTVAGLTTVSCLRIIPEAGPPMQITGIDATGRNRGDLLLVLNCDYALDPSDIQLLTENANSIATNRFAETTASPGGGGGGPYVIEGARGVWLMYDYQENEIASTPPGARWRIIDQA